MFHIEKFETRYSTVLDGEKSKQVPHDWVLLASPPDEAGHVKTKTWHRVDKLKPTERMASQSVNSDAYAALQGRWERIEPAYAAWKDGNELPETGTPLAAWPQLTADQVETLKARRVKTVEELAEMGEAAASLPWPNSRRWPELAQEFLGNRDVVAMQERLEALEAQNAELSAAIEAKPKRGRPPKVEAA